MRYQNIVVLTGAGISAESGIPVFRSETGLWENHRVEDVAEYGGFMRNKNLVHNFYNTMRRSLQDKKPNAAHLALQKLQEGWAKQGGTVTIVTQNIDDLHEKAGTADAVHMHGKLLSIKCESCGRDYPFFEDSSDQSVCKFCGKKRLRPDIGRFGEMPYSMDEIGEALYKCILFMAIGTSGVVYPAAGFCAAARRAGAQCVEFNLNESLVATSFHYGLYGKASATVPAFVDHLLETGELLKKL